MTESKPVSQTTPWRWPITIMVSVFLASMFGAIAAKHLGCHL